jgi:hypothetical protein
MEEVQHFAVPVFNDMANIPRGMDLQFVNQPLYCHRDINLQVIEKWY